MQYLILLPKLLTSLWLTHLIMTVRFSLLFRQVNFLFSKIFVFNFWWHLLPSFPLILHSRPLPVDYSSVWNLFSLRILNCASRRRIGGCGLDHFWLACYTSALFNFVTLQCSNCLDTRKWYFWKCMGHTSQHWEKTNSRIAFASGKCKNRKRFFKSSNFSSCC